MQPDEGSQAARVRRRLAFLTLVLVVLCSPAVFVASAHQTGLPDRAGARPVLDSSTRLKIEPALLKELIRDGDARVPIIAEMDSNADLSALPASATRDRLRQAVAATLRSHAERAQARVRALLSDREAHGMADQVRPFWIFNGVSARTDLDTVLALAELPEVRLVRRDTEFRIVGSPQVLPAGEPHRGTVEWNIEMIRADLAWSALRLDGADVVVANIDTGVDWLHPALHTRYRGYDAHGLHRHACNWYDATGADATYPVDSNGHGTHTMGTAVGENGIGVAPAAQWIAVRAFDSDGVAEESWLHAALEWIVDPGTGCTGPDVVINSWGDATGSKDVFRADVRALRAAAIVAPFAAGNEGPDVSTIDAPASYPEAFAVGAVAPNGQIAQFSSRGPSTWYGANLVKPEVSAPGVNVRSALPGGGYGEASGTSMAAPHVAGMAALMLQASPALTPGQIEAIIKQTARRRGSPIPNNDYGWGRVDAYAAAAAVAQAGTISGTVVRAGNHTPLASALLTAAPSPSGDLSIVTADAAGRYTLGLVSGTYTVTASAFGHVPLSQHIAVAVGKTVERDFALTPLATGTLRGHVTGEGHPIRTGYLIYLPLIGRGVLPGNHASLPLSATLPRPQYVRIAVSGTPVTATVDAAGVYTLSIPAGSYTVTVKSPGYRVAAAADVQVAAGHTTVRNFDLEAAPRILLVDSGAWYYSSQIRYYRQALDDLRYTYDVWAIDDASDDVPDAGDLEPYGIVFWSSPDDSPGYVNASPALIDYLNNGGALFLSGQDVAYYDDSSMLISAPYFGDYLKGRFVRENTDIFDLVATSGEIFDGLTFSIAGPGGADNQTTPDVIQVRNPASASSIVSYVGDDSGGQQVGLCLPYRAILLPFGLEAVTSRAVRREIVSRSIGWFTSARSTAGLEMTPARGTVVGDFGKTVTHTWRVRNTAETGPPEQFVLSLEGGSWSSNLVTSSVTISACMSTPVSLSVRLPVRASWGASDRVTVTARSTGGTWPETSTVRETRTPAPVLLVDDDRWYDVEDSYRRALRANGIPSDQWTVQRGNDTSASSSPSLEMLRMHPMVIWFSGYDWYEPLTPDDEINLTNYLLGGGRLFYSGQDYLSSEHGPTVFARRYLGVLTHTVDITSASVTGVITSPLSSWIPTEELVYPYLNTSDALTPTTSASVAFVDQDGRANGLINSGDGWRTAFLGFNPDGLSTSTQARLMRRIAGWLSWLGGSKVNADRVLARQGQVLTYTVVLRNDGPRPLPGAHLTSTFNADLVPIPSSVQGGADWDDAHSAFVWSGYLASGASRKFSYRATIAAPLPAGYVISHTVWIGYDSHHIRFDRIASTRVNAPQLDGSTFRASSDSTGSGDTLTYTLRISNTGVAPTVVTSTNTLPAGLFLVPGSPEASRGTIRTVGRTITWRMPVAIDDAAALTYTAVVTGAPGGLALHNRAVLTDSLGTVTPVEAVVNVEGVRTYFPLVVRGTNE